MKKPASNMNTKSGKSTKETSAATDAYKAKGKKGAMRGEFSMPKSHKSPKATGMGKKGY